MPNQFNIDYAFPGLCSLCHTEIADFEGSRQIRDGVFRPIIKRLKGIAREADVKLDDGSIMHIAMCKTCYKNFKPEEVKPGDQVLIDQMTDWQTGQSIVTNITVLLPQ